MSVYKVTFLVNVKNIPPNKTVNIAGNQPELGNWEYNQVEFEKINDSTFSKTFSFKEGTNLEYKITSGNWWFEALDSNEQIYDNFELKVDKDTSVSIFVFDWKNSVNDGKIVLNQKRFKPKRTIMGLDNFWKYHAGDNINWAQKDFDDSGWETVQPLLQWGDSLEIKWKNIGWFRFNFIADSSLWNKSLALLIGQLGASEIYYNGKLLYINGEVGDSGETFKPSQVRIWKEIKIDPEPEQVIAVRYANYNWKKQGELGFAPGFIVLLKDINSIFSLVQENTRITANHQMIFTLIPLILFVLHFFIFTFNPTQKENLFYAICLLGFAGVTYFNFEKYIETDPSTIILYYQLNGISVPIAMFFGLLTYFEMAFINIPKRWKVYFVLFITITLMNYFLVSFISVVNYIFFGLITIDIILSSFSKRGKKNSGGGWIVITGLTICSLFIIYQILIDYSVLNSFTDSTQVFVYGMIAFAVSMSLFLSYNFSLINKDLKAQLIKVKELSEKTIEQERIANKLEIERQIINAENERKTKELEEARKLQLSILPKSFPILPQLDISAFMRTAAEVGGDYYDYHLSGDETITLTIGDATGHGTKAGIMVTLVKSLFDAMAHTYFIPDFFTHCTKTIKKMNLGNLYMGMTVLKIKDYRITASAAGMPPFLIFKKNTNSIEEIVLKGMPLGAFYDFQYQQEIIKVEPGDVILLLTDGFIELFNSNREIIDYNLIKKAFADSALNEPQIIINNLMNTAEQWLNGFQQSDDITFLVIKIK